MEGENKTNIKRRRLIGIVVSNKMQKTAVVEVEKLKYHTKYKKYYKVHKKFKAENPDNTYQEGDRVIIELTRPLSKEKRWKIIQKI
ncbi:MAG: 30S ribosomal protein S17 [Minisyncoccia bacterium]|jgi:small subunit ribosomal protein S17